jgi:hypothetical protein
MIEKHEHPCALSAEDAEVVGRAVAARLMEGNVEGAHTTLDALWLRFLPAKPPNRAEMLALPICELGLTVRTGNALESAGIFTLAQLFAASREQLAEIPNVHVATIGEVQTVLSDWRDKLAEEDA